MNNNSKNVEDPALLCLVIDVNSYVWSPSNRDYINVNQVLLGISMAINSLSLLNQNNRLVVVANHEERPRYIFPIESAPKIFEPNSSTSRHVLDAVLAMIQEENSGNSNQDTNAKCSLANALTLGLTSVNKQLLSTRVIPRIVVVRASSDEPHTYNNFMNAVFSAQKLNVPIDSYYFGKEPSLFLQQAASISGGTHFHLSLDASKFAFNLFNYTIPLLCNVDTVGSDRNHARKVPLPIQREIDFRATCSCHSKSMDIGWMCSVCLALYCRESRLQSGEIPNCQVCGTPWDTTNA